MTKDEINVPIALSAFRDKSVYVTQLTAQYQNSGDHPFQLLCPDKMLTSVILTTGRGGGLLGPLAMPIFLTPDATPVCFFMPLSNLHTQKVNNHR